MPRTYSFDHFTARPAASPWKRASASEKEMLSRGGAHAGAVHYGHAHSRTEELYRQHREEHDRQEAMRGPAGGAGRDEEVASVSAHEETSDGGGEAGGVDLRTLAQGAVSSVREAARGALRGRPLESARKLAGEAVSGALRVARDVSARAARSAEDIASRKGPSKRR